MTEDEALQYLIDNTTAIHICSAEPADYSEVAGVSLGYKADPIIGAVSDDADGNRKVTVSLIHDGIVTSDGVVRFLSLVNADDDELLETIDIGYIQIRNANEWNVSAFDIKIRVTPIQSFEYDNNNQIGLSDELLPMNATVLPAGTYEFAVDDGDVLPDGVSIHPTTGQITFDEVPAGIYGFGVKATGVELYGGSLVAQISLTAQSLDTSTILTLSGTLDGANEYEVLLEGGQTIDCTLSGAPYPSIWADIIGEDNAITTAFIASIAGSESGSAIADALDHTNIERISDTVVRVTIPAITGYAIDANEYVSINPPASCFQNDEVTVAVNQVNSDNSLTIETPDEVINALLDKAINEGYSIPTVSVLQYAEQLIVDLKASGVWSKMDIFYWFSSDGDSDFSTLNLVNPELFQIIKVNSPIHTPLEGFLTNATNYLRTFFSPKNNGSNYQLDSACFGGYVRQQIDKSGSNTVWGARDAGVTNLSYSINSESDFINSIAASLVNFERNEDAGFRVTNRISPTIVDRFVNGVKESRSDNSGDRTTNDLVIGALNNAGSVIGHEINQFSFFFAGGGLSDGELNDMFSAIETYMDTIGKGVVS